MNYTKPPLTFAQQLSLLESRGLKIDDPARAIRHLSNISYYRLSAYMRPFRKVDPVSRQVLENFREGTNWDDIINLYKFDRKLRILVFDAIERIEIALRTQIIYQLSHKYGSFWHNDVRVYSTCRIGGKVVDVYKKIQTHIATVLSKPQSAPDFIKHYLTKYTNPPTPPSWMSVELLYFGDLSFLCKALDAKASKSDIDNLATSFALPRVTFLSWLHTINYVRNICAHHARLWNLRLNIVPEQFQGGFNPDRIWITNPTTAQRAKMYYFLCMLLYFMETINPKSKFRQHFFKLIDDYSFVNLGYMGFPSNWRNEKLWQMNKKSWKIYSSVEKMYYLCSRNFRKFFCN